MAKEKKIYAVAVGRRPGIYTTWFGPDGAQAQIAGVKGARYKGFGTLAEAQSWLKSPVAAGHDQQVAVETEGCVIVHTDGGCLNNPGPGGYGAVIVEGEKRLEISEGFACTTNNRMELRACIEALKVIDPDSRVILYSDSSYVVNGISKGWARKWRRNGWIKSNGQPAENCDLWQELLDLLEGRQVVMHWVRGHAGNPENERCDRLANAAARQKNPKTDTAFECKATTVQPRLDIIR